MGKTNKKKQATPVATPAVETPAVVESKPVETPKEEAKKVRGDNVKAAKSTVANPVRVVHQLVAELVKANPEVRRRDLVEAAIEAGCAYYTARTQVQVALKEMKATT